MSRIGKPRADYHTGVSNPFRRRHRHLGSRQVCLGTLLVPALSFSSLGLKAQATELRVNAGAANYTDGNGKLFVADKVFAAGDFGYSGGGTGSFTGTDAAGTTDDLLYQEMRGGPSFSYIFDNLPVGDYDVTLYFMEPWWPAAGDRLFDVTIEGLLVLDDYDIVAAGGGWYVALTEAFTVTVTDAQLNIAFTGVFRNALVSGVSVVTSSPPPNEPDISVSPGTVEFGQVLVGASSDQIITITNDGLETLTVDGLAPTMADSSVVTPATPFDVLPRTSEKVILRFSPLVEGLYSGSLAITSNDPDEGVLDVPLAGEGVPEVVIELGINAGGSDFTDFNAKLFAADKVFVAGDLGYSGGGTGAFTGTDAAGTTDDLLYQEMRGGPSFSYTFDNLPVGDYDVTLHFREPWWPAARDRLFDVNIEGLLALDDYDIVAVGGAWYVAATETFAVSVTDVQLNIDFTGVLQNALVSAICVVTSAPAPNEPDISASPGSVDFGGVLVGASSDQIITITNDGLQTLTVDGLVPAMTDSSVVTPATPFDVLPGASENVILRFSPLEEGLYSGNLAPE